MAIRIGWSQQKGRGHGAADFKAHGEITESDLPCVLAYTWKGNWHEHPERASTARWESLLNRTGTRVTITHSGLANEPTVRKDYGVAGLASWTS